ncbi:hypothetical protein FTO70_01895 [Methanosarcina sp. KYL-1]|uniref:hypothetical protein n=1 Tax=Methanosarcina sp. KYL-1 TaxID=2602068 RepID=UPI002101C1C7|nr:hypothetical protein [Methanosarcina sp. KYL-1]MCQ1534469.1 hypothetical protein [Methanosarcina sp. KYL-1]
MEYLFTIDYGSDAERKRIDYTVERWGERAKIKKPKGAVLLFEGPDVDEFIEDLYSRLDIDAGKVEVYRVEPYEPAVEKQSRKLVYESSERFEALQSFLNYLMSKLGASFEYSTENASHYTVYTKKGQAQLEIRWLGCACGGEDDGRVLRFVVSVEGYGNVVDFIADKLDEEMRIFLG